MCPIGFEKTPLKPQQAYEVLDTQKLEDFQTWIIIGDPSRKRPVFHVKKWEEIQTDISCAFPQFYQIRDQLNIDEDPSDKIQTKTEKRFTEGDMKGVNLHCLIEFKKL